MSHQDEGEKFVFFSFFLPTPPVLASLHDAAEEGGREQEDGGD